MLRRLRTFYHEVAAAVLLVRGFYTENICPNCKYDGDSLSIRCPKHHEKLFDLDGRALEHLDKTPH